MGSSRLAEPLQMASRLRASLRLSMDCSWSKTKSVISEILKIANNDQHACSEIIDSIAKDFFNLILNYNIKIANKCFVCSQFNDCLLGSEDIYIEKIVHIHDKSICGIAALLLSCGDYQLQTALLTNLLIWVTKSNSPGINAKKWFPQSLVDLFNNTAFTTNDFRLFLNAVNLLDEKIVSIQCLQAEIGGINVYNINEKSNSQFWIDINSGSQSISMSYDKFKLKESFQSEDRDYETITIRIENIKTAIFTRKESNWSLDFELINDMSESSLYKLKNRKTLSLKLNLINLKKLRESKLLSTILQENCNKQIKSSFMNIHITRYHEQNSAYYQTTKQPAFKVPKNKINSKVGLKKRKYPFKASAMTMKFCRRQKMTQNSSNSSNITDLPSKLNRIEAVPFDKFVGMDLSSPSLSIIYETTISEKSKLSQFSKHSAPPSKITSSTVKNLSHQDNKTQDLFLNTESFLNEAMSSSPQNKISSTTGTKQVPPNCVQNENFDLEVIPESQEILSNYKPKKLPVNKFDSYFKQNCNLINIANYSPGTIRMMNQSSDDETFDHEENTTVIPDRHITEDVNIQHNQLVNQKNTTNDPILDITKVNGDKTIACVNDIENDEPQVDSNATNDNPNVKMNTASGSKVMRKLFTPRNDDDIYFSSGESKKNHNSPKTKHKSHGVLYSDIENDKKNCGGSRRNCDTKNKRSTLETKNTWKGPLRHSKRIISKRIVRESSGENSLCSSKKIAEKERSVYSEIEDLDSEDGFKPRRETPGSSGKKTLSRRSSAASSTTPAYSTIKKIRATRKLSYNNIRLNNKNISKSKTDFNQSQNKLVQDVTSSIGKTNDAKTITTQNNSGAKPKNRAEMVTKPIDVDIRDEAENIAAANPNPTTPDEPNVKAVRTYKAVNKNIGCNDKSQQSELKSVGSVKCKDGAEKKQQDSKHQSIVNGNKTIPLVNTIENDEPQVDGDSNGKTNSANDCKVKRKLFTTLDDEDIGFSSGKTKQNDNSLKTKHKSHDISHSDIKNDKNNCGESLSKEPRRHSKRIVSLKIVRELSDENSSKVERSVHSEILDSEDEFKAKRSTPSSLVKKTLTTPVCSTIKTRKLSKSKTDQSHNNLVQEVTSIEKIPSSTFSNIISSTRGSKDMSKAFKKYMKERLEREKLSAEASKRTLMDKLDEVNTNVNIIFQNAQCDITRTLSKASYDAQKELSDMNKTIQSTFEELEKVRNTNESISSKELRVKIIKMHDEEIEYYTKKRNE